MAQFHNAPETVLTASPRVRSDGTELPGNAERNAARRLIVLTRDPALEGALEGMGADVPLLVVDALAQLTDELMQRGAVSALLDIHALDAPVDAVVDALAAQFPDLRLMVAGQAADQSLLATRISEQTVFRFVHKPASPQRLKLFLDAAFRTPLRQEARRSAPPPVPGTAQNDAGQPSGGGPLRSGALPYVLIGLVAAAIAGTAGWYFSRKPAAPPATTLVAPAASAAPEVDARAAQLEQALRAAEAALLAGRLEEAATATAQARAIEPANPRIAFLATQIEREQARLNADSAQREAVENRQGLIRRALTSFEERLGRGALVEPLGDSAVSRLREAESIAPRDPAVLAARDALVAALLTEADKSLSAGRTDSARRLVDVTAQVNARAPGLDLFRRRVEEVAARANVVTPPAEPVRAVPTPEPVQVAAAPAPAAAETKPATPPAAAPAEPRPGETVISATRLTSIRKVEARYPEQAYQSMTSGWVDMEFSVMKDGSVDNVIVTASEPGRTFDSAAVSALRRYRYLPVLRDGVPVEQRARLRMRFTAQASN
jgi:TonB family protein